MKYYRVEYDLVNFILKYEWFLYVSNLVVLLLILIKFEFKFKFVIDKYEYSIGFVVFFN